ncbi:MarR family transcriptional regulator, partial [Streptomyces sp. SID5926]|nr:MarR family transcriptional regulator [Streptomyces sp. SID5926]
MATANQRGLHAHERGAGSGPEASDLHVLAVQLRRMNGEINRVVHGFA